MSRLTETALHRSTVSQLQGISPPSTVLIYVHDIVSFLPGSQLPTTLLLPLRQRTHLHCSHNTMQYVLYSPTYKQYALMSAVFTHPTPPHPPTHKCTTLRLPLTLVLCYALSLVLHGLQPPFDIVLVRGKGV